MSIKALVKRAPALWFFGLAIPLQALLVWAEATQRAPTLVMKARIYMPAVIALGLTALCKGRTGLRKTFRSLVNLRVRWPWFVLALLYAPVVGVLPLLAFRAAGAIDHVDYDTNIVGGAGWLFFKFILTISIVEEISWVSFGIEHLRPRFTAFVAALLGGAAWGLWYVPLNIAGIQMAGTFPNIPLVINFMAIGACCSWVYIHTQSALLVALMQVVTNYTSLAFPVLPKPGHMGVYYGFIATKFAFALAVFLWRGPLPLWKPQTQFPHAQRQAA